MLVFIHHGTRLVRIAGDTTNPVAEWVTQQARNLSMELADHANSVTFLIRDRDTEHTASFDAVFAELQAAAHPSIRLAVRTPARPEHEHKLVRLISSSTGSLARAG